jgi:hypothetical protein
VNDDDQLDDRLMFLCPIRRGWSMIGRTDKYLSPSTAEFLIVSDTEFY